MAGSPPRTLCVLGGLPLPSGRSLGAASELGGSSLDLVLAVIANQRVLARTPVGRGMRSRTISRLPSARSLLRFSWGTACERSGDASICRSPAPGECSATGADRRLGHPTATSSAMRNSVLVARARGRQARGRCQPTLLPSSRGEQEFRHALRGLSSSRSAAGPSLEPSKYPTSWAAARKKAGCLVSKAVTRGQCQDGAGF